MTRGEGAYVYDPNGKRYLDGLAGLFVVQADHGRREQYSKLAGRSLKHKVISRNVAYHGTPQGALWITGVPDAKKCSAASSPRRFSTPACNCRADDRGDPVVQLSPPLIVGQAEFDEMQQILRTVLTEAWAWI